MDRALADGYSSAGTTGNGLGAIRRQADEFDIYSQPGQGTAVLARFYARRAVTPEGLVVGGINVPVHGEPVSGDTWAMRSDGPRTAIMAADGLGHGLYAAEASQAAVSVLQEPVELDPVPIIERVHAALHGTRGAAVALALIDLAQQRVRFAGVGNIAAIIFDPGGGMRHLVSHNGTAGHSVRHIQEFTYPWPAAGFMVMHSDGLTTSWRMDAYPGLSARHPSVIAGFLYLHAARGRDDVSVIAARGAGF